MPHVKGSRIILQGVSFVQSGPFWGLGIWTMVVGDNYLWANRSVDSLTSIYWNPRRRVVLRNRSEFPMMQLLQMVTMVYWKTVSGEHQIFNANDVYDLHKM